MASPTTGNGTAAEKETAKPRKDRPCDACRKRKSRCVLNEGSQICVLCDFHHQDCTFLQSTQPRKRRLTDAGTAAADDKSNKRRPSYPRSPEQEQPPRKTSNSNPSLVARPNKPPVRDYADLKGPSLLKKTLGLQIHRHSRHVGITTELEPVVLRLATFNQRDEGQFARNIIRKVSDHGWFIMQPDEGTQNYEDEIGDLDKIEAIVEPHGPALVKIYFRIVHPSFPILHKRVFLEKYSRSYREFSPALLAAVYILALNWWSYSSDLADLSRPDLNMLERIALKAMNDVIQRPKLSTVQAGLLLLQRPNGDSRSLTAQLISIAQDLGLHLDCSNWKIPQWEQGLRRRIAWGLYMQDKWSALIYGTPTQIHEANWMVKPVTKADFPENAADEDEGEGSTEVEKGMILFTQMIALTRILSEILDTFYLLRSVQNMESEGGTQAILAKAKPVQIRLKDWFTALPECLGIESTKVMKLSSTGYLHLAYYTTEITLHRFLIRSLPFPSSSPQDPLHTIVRTAARTRLTSAIDFVHRLRPEHLQSFWYFASSTNLAIIGSFGCLLWATAESPADAESYKTKLGEYKWTLRVSSKGAEWMGRAVGIIDAGAALLGDFWERERKNSASELANVPFSQDADHAQGYMIQDPAAYQGHYDTSNSYQAAMFAPEVSPSETTMEEELYEYYDSNGAYEHFGFMHGGDQWMDVNAAIGGAGSAGTEL